MKTEEYDIVIVGGGVSGTALFYVLAEYTDIKRIAIVEQYPTLASVNSAHIHNSQTLHFGDIETNYTLEKAAQVNSSTRLIKRYVNKELEKEGSEKIFSKYSKMVLAVGETQARALESRYNEFRHLFPGLKMIGRSEIAQIEPKVIEGRDPNEEVLALVTEDGYTVDFAGLSQSFVNNSLKNDDRCDLHLSTRVNNIEKTGEGYTLNTDETLFKARSVVVATGGHSLLMAKSLGYGKEFSLLSVAGNFFWAPKLLNGKVYTMQRDKLPFAAVHGDPDVYNADETRFGPTAKALPVLERFNFRSIREYFVTCGFNTKVIASFVNILSDGIILRYIMTNFLYDIPVLGKLLFLKEVKKIVPTVKYSDLSRAKGAGGIRPQVVNTTTKSLDMGEAKIFGDKIIFNITPSPGASTCLGSAHIDAQKIVEFLGSDYSFNSQSFEQDFR